MCLCVYVHVYMGAVEEDGEIITAVNLHVFYVSVIH